MSFKMRAGYYCLSIIALFFALLLIAVGLAMAAFPSVPHLRLLLQHFLQSYTPLSLILSGGLILLGLTLLLVLYALNPRQVYQLKSGPNLSEVALPVIQKNLSLFWKKKWPGAEIASDVWLEKGVLQIAAELPQLPFESQKQLLEKIEKELKSFLESLLGYKGEFIFKASFGFS